MWMEDLRLLIMCAFRVLIGIQIKYFTQVGFLAYLKGISSKDDISHIYGVFFFFKRESVCVDGEEWGNLK